MFQKKILAVCVAAILPLLAGCNNDDDSSTDPSASIPGTELLPPIVVPPTDLLPPVNGDVGPQDFVDQWFSSEMGFSDAGYYEIPNQDELNPGTGSQTVAFWFRIPTAGTVQLLVQKGNSSSNGKGWSVYTASNRLYYRTNMTGGFSNNVKYDLHADLSGYDLNEWHQFSAVINQEDELLEAWINGEKLDPESGQYLTTFAPADLQTADPIRVHQKDTGYLINDLRYFDRALSQDDVDSFFNVGNSDPEGMLTYTRVEEKSYRFSAMESSDPDGDELKYYWDFGDGKVQIGAEAEHTFEYGGKYTVKLMVVDPWHNMATITETIEVEGEPNPTITLFKSGTEPGEDATNAYRIPAIQSAMGDYVFAFAEGRPDGGDPGKTGEIVLAAKFSKDGGDTWSEVENISKTLDPEFKYDFSDSRPIYNEETGELMIVYTQWPTDCAQNGDCVKPDDENKLFTQSFDFNSNTWDAPVDITAQTRERAWDARGWGGPASWKFDIADNTQGLNTELWSLVTERKVTQGKITDYLRTDDRMFLPSVNLTADNDLVVEFNGDNSGPHTLVENIGPANFYTSEIIYNPVSKKASYVFDGKTIIENWAGAELAKGKQVVFGNDESSADGRASYKRVTFKIGGTTVKSYDASVPVTADANPAAQGWTAYTGGTGAGILGWKSVNAGPGNGIQLKWQTTEQGDHNGRMILPAIILDGYGTISVKSVYSDDHGSTWDSGAYVPTAYAWSGSNLQQAQPSESDLVELTNGRLLLTTRNDGQGTYGDVFYGPRMQFISDNGGETWTYDQDSTLPKNIDEVDASLIRYSGAPDDDNTMLLFSAPIGNVPGDKKRTNLGIWHSTDEGTTWNGPKQVWTGESWYSDMTMMPDGKVGILVETGGYNISLLKKDISELMPEVQPQP